MNIPTSTPSPTPWSVDRINCSIIDANGLQVATVGHPQDVDLMSASPEMREVLDLVAGLIPALCLHCGIVDDAELGVKVKSTGEERNTTIGEICDKILAALLKADGGKTRQN